MTKKQLLVIVFLLVSTGLLAQLKINEFCPINSILEDEEEETNAWAELYNASDNSLSTANWFLSNQSDQAYLWALPAFSLPPHTTVLVFLSGKTSASGEIHSSFEVESNLETLYLSFGGLGIQDQMSGRELQPNHSRARIPDGHATLSVSTQPTPNTSNNGMIGFNGYCPKPLLDKSGGFYSKGITIKLLYPSVLSETHFTTDGQEPTQNSAIFPSVWPIESNTSIRIKNFPKSSSDKLLPSEETDESYFIESKPELEVVSLSTDSNYFFSWDSGIFVLGPNASFTYPYYGANFWADQKVPVHFEWFEKNGKKTHDQWLDCEIHGGSQNRTRPMKSLHLEAKTKYGNNRLEHQFFKNLPASRFKSLVLRNGSGDFNKLHCRDESVHELMLQGGMDLDLNPYRPVLVYFNAQFLGVYNVREKLDKHYLNEHHPEIDKDNLDLIEEDAIAHEGDFENWNQLFSFIQTHDLAQQVVFDSVSNWLDLSNFTDYFIAETFLTNIDWPNNNMKYWRERKPGAKWRYLPIDFDITLGNIGWAPANYNMFERMFELIGPSNKQVFILQELLKYPPYKQYFINRYADAMNSLFTQSSLLTNTQQCLDRIKAVMPRQFDRWGGSMEAWQTEFNTMALPYIMERTDFAREHLRDYFGLANPYLLRLQCIPEPGGTIHINTLKARSSGWEGWYFPDVPVTIQPEPRPGYTFQGWLVETDSTHFIPSDSLVILVEPQQKITAVYNRSDSENEMLCFPNPNSSPSLTLLWQNSDPSAYTLAIYNSNGEKVFTKSCTAIGPVYEEKVSMEGLPNGLYLVNAGKFSGKIIKINP